MKDFNFFEPYVDTGNSIARDRNRLIIIIVAMVLAFIIIAIPAYQQFRIILAQRDIRNTEEFIASTESQRKLNDLSYKEDLLADMTDKNQRIESVELELEKKDTVGNYIIDMVSSVFPEGVFLSNISIDRSNISMNLIGDRRESVAFTINNFRRSEDFENVSASGGLMPDGSDFYSFTVQVQLKQEGEDESDAEVTETTEDQDAEASEEGED